jgi:hypothetical protein
MILTQITCSPICRCHERRGFMRRRVLNTPEQQLCVTQTKLNELQYTPLRGNAISLIHLSNLNITWRTEVLTSAGSVSDSEISHSVLTPLYTELIFLCSPYLTHTHTSWRYGPNWISCYLFYPSMTQEYFLLYLLQLYLYDLILY